MQKLVDDLRCKGKSIGFVPTMGYFHEGHLALMRRSKKENDITVVSLFVNPLQFGPKEDFNKYPRNERRDAKMAQDTGVDIFFMPKAIEMYKESPLITVKVAGLSDILCGASRPGHFDGVATVVTKLLNIVRPHKMYLGQKDAQQVIVLKRMVQDLNFPVDIRTCPTVREPDGLAMSSRNSYLSTEERAKASFIYKALEKAKQAVAAGERSGKSVEKIVKTMIDKSTDGRIDYVTCVDAETLRPQKTLKGRTMIAVAVKLGRTRLIDNIVFSC
jgi:pantoate--beta-alanine ligase